MKMTTGKKKCVICNDKIEEDSGKLGGTALKLRDGKNYLVYVCFDCQKKLKTKEAILEKLG